ncbi:RimK family alpha-L-glutamate ligase [Ramlibacter sp. G-1-2-2]|uniref:RimK family alpha-L-glutamate ligase n=1 Tax=Ramlibacter agri TaxID=2728837 RepID=A0A848H3D0_9BURK|nr:RimK family alpha-L-glutamate ligase [Ramlibacter agri]NML44071.1 RimK family alpha-L-glutamate ligase [Ramlibacter agri]
MNRATPDTSPGHLLDLTRLMPLAFEGADLTPLAQQMISRAQCNVDDAEAWLDLSTILMLQGSLEEGLAVQAQALQIRRAFQLKSATGAQAVRVLALMTPGDLMTNSPIGFLVEHSEVALAATYILPGEALPPELPEHDVLFVAISQSESTDPLLLRLAELLATWRRPVLNAPALIAQTHRAKAFGLLSDVPGLRIMSTAAVLRAQLEALAAGHLDVAAVLAGASFPVIVRPVDSHAGRALARMDCPRDLSEYLASTPGHDFFISPFADYRSTDGQFRKYRIVLVDGEPFAAHMAISGHWMIHYLNAGMTQSAAKREEEGQFLEQFATGFAARHQEALRAVHARLPLDYLVIDCGETQDGGLLVFELDPGAVVHSMDPADMFPSKPAAMRKIYAAFEAMLQRRARTGLNPA